MSRGYAIDVKGCIVAASHDCNIFNPNTAVLQVCP